MRKQITDIKEAWYLYTKEIKNCYFKNGIEPLNEGYNLEFIHLFVWEGRFYHETQEPKRMAGMYCNIRGNSYPLYKKNNILYWFSDNKKCPMQNEWHRIPTIPEWEIDENNKPIGEDK